MSPTHRHARFPALVVGLLLAAGCGDGGRATSSELSDQSGAVMDSAAAPPPVAAGPASAGSVGDGRRMIRPTATRAVAEQSKAAPSAQDAAGAGATAAQPTTNMLIRTGSATLEVDSLETATARVREAVERLGGFVANSSLQVGRDQVRSAELQVRVPSARFDELLRGLDPIGRVEAVNVSTEDVGEEFVDVQARMANARRLEERLVQLLATRTGKLDDVLSVERELARVREEIERAEGRLRYLRTRVAMSTLMVTVHEPSPIVGNVRGERPIADAVRQAWRNFVALVALVIAMSGVLIPLAAVGAAAYALHRRWQRRRTVPLRVESVAE